MKKTSKVRIKSASLSVLGIGGGLGWEIDDSERKAARRLIAFLEDRRVLFQPVDLEHQRHASISVDEIRSECTEVISSTKEGAPLIVEARGIRQACRRFLDYGRGTVRGSSGEAEFLVALGELRGIVALHILAIAQDYGIKVEADLAAALPTPKADDE